MIEQQLQIVTAMGELQRGLSDSFKQSFVEVNGKLATLLELHHATLLKQAERNATFADRARAEEIAIHVHDNASAIMSLTGKVADVVALMAQTRIDLEKMRDSISEGTAASSTEHIGILSGYTRDVVYGFGIVIAAVLTFILTHLK